VRQRRVIVRASEVVKNTEKRRQSFSAAGGRRQQHGMSRHDLRHRDELCRGKIPEALFEP
jgi:hypothetical protein